ncbi:MAG: tol-pal system protein YbgF [Deltaproteobacteria bacterium]|nr:tol-pal system protein YbgF [Deltaproteobacteria bacterium]
MRLMRGAALPRWSAGTITPLRLFALSALCFAALQVQGCGPGFPIMTKEQESLSSNVEMLLKENEALKKRLSAIEEKTSGAGAKKDMGEVKKGLADAVNEMEKLRQEFSFVQGTIETSDHDKGQVRDSLKSLGAAVAALNERAASIEAALKEAIGRGEAFRLSSEANEKRIIGVQESVLSLDYRTSVLEGKPAKGVISPDAKPSKKSTKAKPEEVYDAGFKAIKAKDYRKAIEAFSAFIEDWPEHKLAGNAAYWLGSAHYAKGDFEKAALELDKAVKKYPASEKTPAAMLKEGLSLEKLGMKKEAKALLEDLVEKYPKAQEVKKARERLKEIK